MRTTLIVLAAAVPAVPVLLQEGPAAARAEAPKATVVVKHADIKWVDHPYVPGGKMSVQDGDPAKGPSVLMMKFPKGTTIPPHWHTSNEVVTVAAGSAVFGSGEKIDESKGTPMTPGSYASIPGKAPHWSVVKEDFVITLTLNKPSDFHLCGEAK